MSVPETEISTGSASAMLADERVAVIPGCSSGSNGRIADHDELENRGSSSTRPKRCPESGETIGQMGFPVLESGCNLNRNRRRSSRCRPAPRQTMAGRGDDFVYQKRLQEQYPKPICRQKDEKLYFTLPYWPPSYAGSSASQQRPFALQPAGLPTSASTSLMHRSHHSSKLVTFRLFSNREKSVWLRGGADHGFIRIYDPDSRLHRSLVVPCTVDTTAAAICAQLGLAADDLHLQFGGDLLRRLTSDNQPLKIQNSFLASIGFDDQRQQDLGDSVDLGWMIRFYAGRPSYGDACELTPLSSYCYVRKGCFFQKWSKKLCVLFRCRLLIFGEETRESEPETVLLQGRTVQMAFTHSRGRVLKLVLKPDRQSLYLSFETLEELDQWLSRCLKATQRSHKGADYTCLQMETIPEEVFFTGNDPVVHLNLKHNCLVERQPNSNKYFVGFLDDLPLLTMLKVLNLSDNDLLIVPPCLFQLRHLTELSLVGNKIRELPPQIGILTSLKVLNLQNNWLESLPEELRKCELLTTLDVSFNRFRNIPSVLTMMSSIEEWLFSGNAVSQLRLMILFDGPVHVRKIELRHNKLLSLPTDETAFGLLHCLTHLDISDNATVVSLELSYLTSLQYLSCKRCNITSITLSSQSLTEVQAGFNKLKTFTINPIPRMLKIFDIAHNRMELLPDWVCRSVKIEKICASYNYLSALPECLFTSLPCLKHLELDHNCITILPDRIENCYIEVLLLHRNLISSLPEEFFASLHRLKILNLSYNALSFLPAASPLVELNKIMHLQLCNNSLTEDALLTISNFRRLRKLNLSYNYITSLPNSFLEKLQNLEELCVSGNALNSLPPAVCSLPNLTVLRAHSNYIKEVPNFSKNVRLKILDLACNQLINVQIRSLVNPKLRTLDISCNDSLRINPQHVQQLHPEKFISLVDVNKEIKRDGVDLPWKIGFVETPGERNKMCVFQIRRCLFGDSHGDALFGIVDGDANSEVSSLMQDALPAAVEAAQHAGGEYEDGPYLKNALLACQKDLKALGQKLGVSCVVCHLVTNEQRSTCEVRVANCGLTEAVLCRNGEPVILSRKFSVTHMPDEYNRIRQAGAILTENNVINGVTSSSRLIGKYYLYPAIIPVPHEAVFKLNTLDEFLVIANRSFWETVDETEAVELIRQVQDPIRAAKRLQDTAQAYGHNGNLSIIVIRFLFKSPRRLASNFLKTTPRRVAKRAPALSLTNLTTSEGGLFSDDEIRSEPRTRQLPESPNYYFQCKKNHAAPRENSSTAELSENFSSVSTVSADPAPPFPYPRMDDNGYSSSKTKFCAFASSKLLPMHFQRKTTRLTASTKSPPDAASQDSAPLSLNRTETVFKHVEPAARFLKF